MALYQVVTSVVDSADTSNPFVNSFFYNVDDVVPTSTTAAALADEFYDTVINSATGWKSIVVPVSVLKAVTVTSPYSDTVLAIRPHTTLGVRSGAALPRFGAWGFKSERTRSDIRAGFKRFGRISETDTSGDVPSSGMVSVLAAFALNMAATLTFSDGVSSFNAVPVIVKRIRRETPLGVPYYVLPNSDGELEYSIADNWAFQAITTQNSRKS